MRKILFLVLPQTHLLDLNGPAHVFYEAKEMGAKMSLHFISIDERTELKSSAGLHFSKLEHYENFTLNKDDLVIIPGSDYNVLSNQKFLASSKPFFEWLIQQNEMGAQICSVCTGAFLLAETGLLNYRNATTHWKYYKRFAERFPAVKLIRNCLFVENEGFLCSAGVSSGIDLSLYLIEQFYGSKFAADVSREVLIYFRRSGTEPQLSIFLQFRNHVDSQVHEVQDLISGDLTKSWNIDELAAKVFMSPRNLTRTFKKTTGATIGDYTENLRFEKAIQLMSENHKVDFITQQVGLRSPNQLRSLLKKHTEVPFEAE